MATFPSAIQFPVQWWGYPLHGKRRIKPTIALVVHITGNSGLPPAINEAKYSNRAGSGASFTFVTNRDGSIVQCLDPDTQTPWTNGDIKSPNTTIPTVKAMVGSNYNPNEFCYATCENVGYEPTYPLTNGQVATLVRLAAWASQQTGLPINRSTVLGHRDINSVTRYNCPTRWNLDALLGRIIDGANAILTPQPPQEGDMTPVTLKPVRQDWWTHIGDPAGVFWTGGPGLGAKKHFTSRDRVTSFAETADGTWIVLAYGAEVLWMLRANLDAIAGTRQPATGYGLPAASSGFTQAQLDAASAAAAAAAATAARAAGIAAAAAAAGAVK